VHVFIVAATAEGSVHFIITSLLSSITGIVISLTCACCEWRLPRKMADAGNHELAQAWHMIISFTRHALYIIMMMQVHA
jgi:hypothetical protein